MFLFIVSSRWHFFVAFLYFRAGEGGRRTPSERGGGRGGAQGIGKERNGERKGTFESRGDRHCRQRCIRRSVLKVLMSDLYPDLCVLHKSVPRCSGLRYFSFAQSYSRFGSSGIYKARTKLIRRRSSMTMPNECAKYTIWLCDVSKYRCRTLEY